MDTQKLISDAKARFKYHENKLYLQEKYKNRLTFANQGGMWTITTELLAFLSTAPTEVIITDDFNNPVKIKTAELHKASLELYTAVMKEWYSEYSTLQNLR